MSKTGTELSEDVRRLLNRPDDDDLLDPANDLDTYLGELGRARDRARQKIVMHAPNLLYETVTVGASDAEGTYYTLSDDHLGELQVYAPPGARTGIRIYPGQPGMYDQRFWMEGRNMYLTQPRVYSPGLYVRWIPATADSVTKTSDSSLSSFMDWFLIYDAAAQLAKRPGIGVDFRVFDAMRDEEWVGRRGDPSWAESRRRPHHR